MQVWKTVRVFISSTFRDMQAERDHLVRFVFPKLREELLARRIHFVDVDLRWGVTSEQDASEVCREIIDECRPRFLCMLGGRYGTIPEGNELSITADEVHFGVLDVHRQKIYGLFYFRNGAVTEMMDKSNPGSIREPRHSEKAVKLALLKRDIRKAKRHPFLYRPRWNADEERLLDLKTFGDRVEQDILATIDDEFGVQPPAQLDEFAEENAAMEAFAEERSERFVLGSRETVLNELLSHASATVGNGYVCLTGAPGSGKSTLLAHLLSQHSTLNSQPATLLIRHFVGASPGSTDVRRTLRRLCHELKVASTDITADIPDDPEKLRVAFPDFLRQACAQKRIVILLDAINQFDPASHSAGLHWLPNELPANARVILSALDGPALEELRRRHKPREIELKPLTQADGEAIIEQFRQLYRKEFEPEQRAALLAKTDASTPLYLLAALEELRTLGTYEEITRRISELPPTTQALFAWILERLENDDGFRDAAGRQVGLELASRFAALLGASRYGLSQCELTDLLDAGDPQGNVAALLYLLRSYLMHRGELLDFYHSQFRAAVENRYLADDEARRSVHLVLAEHFRRAADPEGRGEWDGNSTRGLRELPFHTAGSDDQAEIVALLTSLPYLSARVATGNAYQLAEDYALTVGPPEFVEWRDFIVRHSQRLTNHPKMLVALVQHEGFRSARLQVLSRTWRYPWLRTWEEPAPPGRPEPTGLHLEIKSDKRFAHGRVSAVAWQARLIFSVERLGSIAIMDYRNMEELLTRVSVGSGRPVKIACAPDASSLMVILEPGTAELYRCTFGTHGRPVAFELVARFSCCLPEIDDPVVEWHENAYWMQIRPGMLARVDAVTALIREEPLCGGTLGELGALMFFDAGRTFAAVRQGHSTILGGVNGVSVRRVASDLCTACSCGNRAAAFFADGSAVMFDATETHVEMAKIQSGIVRGAAGWDGKRLLWLKESADFAKLHSWRPGESAIQMVGGGQKVFAAELDVTPRTWGDDGEGGTLLLTSHSVVRFHTAEGGSMRAGRMEWLFGGTTWRAVRKEDKAQWLWDGSAGSEVCLGTDIPGRLYCALDGRGQFYTARVDRSGMVWDFATLQTKPLYYPTMLFNMVVGDPEKGCWFSDRKGGIYYASDDSELRLVAAVEDGTGAILHVCGEHLLWWGTIPHYHADTGVDQGRAFVFFRRRPGRNQPLERIGERLFKVQEGLCLAMDYDDTRGRLVLLWQPEGKYPVLRTATVEEFLADQFVDHELNGAGPLGNSRIAISPDGRVLAILNSGRELICVSTDTGERVASLAGSLPFTQIAPGGEGSSFWLVQAHDAVYGCALVEPA